MRINSSYVIIVTRNIRKIDEQNEVDYNNQKTQHITLNNGTKQPYRYLSY